MSEAQYVKSLKGGKFYKAEILGEANPKAKKAEIVKDFAKMEERIGGSAVVTVPKKVSAKTYVRSWKRSARRVGITPKRPKIRR